MTTNRDMRAVVLSACAVCVLLATPAYASDIPLEPAALIWGYLYADDGTALGATSVDIRIREGSDAVTVAATVTDRPDGQIYRAALPAASATVTRKGGQQGHKLFFRYDTEPYAELPATCIWDNKHITRVDLVGSDFVVPRQLLLDGDVTLKDETDGSTSVRLQTLLAMPANCDAIEAEIEGLLGSKLEAIFDKVSTTAGAYHAFNEQLTALTVDPLSVRRWLIRGQAHASAGAPMADHPGGPVSRTLPCVRHVHSVVSYRGGVSTAISPSVLGTPPSGTTAVAANSSVAPVITALGSVSGSSKVAKMSGTLPGGTAHTWQLRLVSATSLDPKADQCFDIAGSFSGAVGHETLQSGVLRLGITRTKSDGTGTEQIVVTHRLASSRVITVAQEAGTSWWQTRAYLDVDGGLADANLDFAEIQFSPAQSVTGDFTVTVERLDLTEPVIAVQEL